jgi:DNA replication licensing factor MCM5
VPGIITSASKPEVKACMLRVQCSNCGNVKSIPLTKGLGGALIPRMCDNASIVTQNKEKCPLDSYVIMPQKSDFINQQTFKLQENPELIPTGEMPRSFLLTCDRYLVDKMTPGMRVKVIGVFCLLNRKSKEKGDRPLNISYIRAIGIHTEEALRYQSVLSQEDQNHIIGLAKQKDIHQKIFKSIGSSIYGSDNIKQALACLLFGGSPKVLPDKTKLRADINVLLLGDPSTAKSQFLKFVERYSHMFIYL